MPEPKPEELEDYLGGPHDLLVLTKYHVHVARMAPHGVQFKMCKQCEKDRGDT